MTDIYANHAHVFPADINPAGTIDRLLQLLDACGIAGAVCFAPLPHPAGPARRDANGWLAEALNKHDRLRGFGTVDLRRTDRADQVRRIAELGLRGVKLHPNSQGFDVLEPAALEVYAAAQEHGLFITFHTGVHASRLSATSVTKFDEVAEQFPRLRFSMEHMGGYHFFHEALAVLFNRYPPPWEPNKPCHVYAGLTSIFTQHQNRMWYLRPDQILEIILQTSARQCIFGLDFPYNLERETLQALDTLRQLPISEADRALILGGNLRREIGWT